MANNLLFLFRFFFVFDKNLVVPFILNKYRIYIYIVYTNKKYSFRNQKKKETKLKNKKNNFLYLFVVFFFFLEWNGHYFYPPQIFIKVVILVPI